MSESFFVVYNDQGVILRNGLCADEDIEHQARPGQIVVVTEQGVKGSTHYMEGETPVLKEQMTPVVEGNKITGLPIPCIAQSMFDGSVHEIDDGIIELDTEEPGSYQFYISALKYISQTVTITI